MGKEAEWGGVAPMQGWASVVLKERQEVIITIARQVGGIQVREELVGVCEFWKELEEKYRSPVEVSAEGWASPGQGRQGIPRPVCLPSTCLLGPWPKQGKLSAGGPQIHPGHHAGPGHTVWTMGPTVHQLGRLFNEEYYLDLPQATGGHLGLSPKTKWLCM